MMTRNQEAETRHRFERERESDMVQAYLREAREYLDAIGATLDNIEAVQKEEST
jgi:hypothetical protein